MAIVDINVNYLKNNLEQSKKNFNNYKENISDLNNELKKVDTAWKDINTPYFLKQLNIDYNNFNNHIQSMIKTVNYISSFLDNILTILKNNTGISQISKFYLDSQGINKAIGYLNNVNEYLNHNINILANMAVPSDFIYKQQIKNIMNNCIIIRDNMVGLNQRIYNINNNYLKILSDCRRKTNQIDSVKIDTNVMDYTYKVTGAGKILNPLSSLEKIRNDNLVNSNSVKNLNVDSDKISTLKYSNVDIKNDSAISDTKSTIHNDNSLENNTILNVKLSPIETETIKNSNEYNFVNNDVNEFESDKEPEISVNQNSLYNFDVYSDEIKKDNDALGYNSSKNFNDVANRKLQNNKIKNLEIDKEKDNEHNYQSNSLSISDRKISNSNFNLNNENSSNQISLASDKSSVIIDNSNINSKDNLAKTSITNSSIVFDNHLNTVNDSSSNLSINNTTTQV